MGSRFDSDVRSKDHLKPKKKDGPGPGSYELHSSIRQVKQLKNPTFGKAGRDWSDLPKDSPAPNLYKNIVKHTETAYAFSIPRAARSNEDEVYKQSILPAPNTYVLSRELAGGLAKSILGGPLDKKDIINGVPGPGTYDSKGLYHPPGFRIVPHTNSKADKGEEVTESVEGPVGPQRYHPSYPTHTDNSVKIGSGTRDDPKPSNFFAPAPTTYDLLGQFEKAKANPKFHMGIKVGLRGNKNFDQPGPGEYETDVAPLNN
jgi:hypothetical protein